MSDMARHMGERLRRARLAIGMRQVDVARRTGVSPSWVGKLELGHGDGATLETWEATALAVGLASIMDLVSIDTMPSDRRPAMARRVEELANLGGWTSAVDADSVILARRAHREVAVIHVWDVVVEVVASIAALRTTIDTERRNRGHVTIRGLAVVLATGPNRRRISESDEAIDAAFPDTGSMWIRALSDPRSRLPPRDSLVWMDTRMQRLIPARLELIHRRRMPSDR